jgi:hypothetical protein
MTAAVTGVPVQWVPHPLKSAKSAAPAAVRIEKAAD